MQLETVGDAYLGVAGVPEEEDGHACSATNMAISMVSECRNVSHPTHQDIVIKVIIEVLCAAFCSIPDESNVLRQKTCP